MYHNYQFSSNIFVTITANNHINCLTAARQVKMLCNAWQDSVSFSETKSARKGDVLERCIQICQTAFPSKILIFDESLRHICNKYHHPKFKMTITLEFSTIPVIDVVNFNTQIKEVTNK